MSLNIGVIGCGKMAYAILAGISRDKNLIKNIFVNDINKESANLFVQEFNAVFKGQNNLVETSDLIILAVKPPQIKTLITDNLDFFKESHIIISIAAGIKTSTIENLLKVKSTVIRVMPNTPALVGQGVTAISGGLYANSEKVNLVRNLFTSIGTAYLVDENNMDAITAISGSGPAYIFLFIEALINAGVYIGLDHKLTQDLVVNTLKGSIAILEETSKHPAVLRDEVSSPAGTTISAIRELEDNGLRNAIFAAVEAAFYKAQELSEG